MTASSNPPRRHLALHFPFWATDWRRRVDRDLDPAQPLALYEKRQNAMRLVAVDAEAHRLGLRTGQTLADARMLCPQVLIRRIDQGATLAAFEALADWHVSVSPIVSVAQEAAPYGDLMLDTTGVDHLWDGERPLLEAVVARLRGLGLTVHGAIAPSVGAAWGLARFAPMSVITGEVRAALAPLPVTALRLDPHVVSGLLEMGLTTIGLLYGRSRRALTARYGYHLLLRLDQALGEIQERVIPRLPASDFKVEQRFAEPLAQIESILAVVGGLAVALCRQLEEAEQGAQSFELQLFRVDHKLMSLAVHAAGATRDADHIARLFANRIERLREDFDAGFGIEMIRLGASVLSLLKSEQFNVLERSQTGDLVQLYDRLTSRLGQQAVLAVVLENSFLPERAARFEPVGSSRARGEIPGAVDGPRPLRLFPTPDPVQVMAEVPDGPPLSMVWRHLFYRFVRASGPERIAAEWWQETTTFEDRDYYRVEDETGRRFWLFRQGLYRQTRTPQWFVHGIFA